MGWIEQRIAQLEAKVENLYRRLLDVIAQLDAVRQALRAAFQQLPTGGTSTGADVYVATPSAAVAAATYASGAPSSPASFPATVYQVSGTAATNLGTQTVYNWLPSTLAASKVCLLARDSAGNYCVLTQSCT